MVVLPKSLHLCSVCLHEWRVPQFALKYPCNPPCPRVGRPSLGDRLPPHPRGGDRCALQGGNARWWGLASQTLYGLVLEVNSHPVVQMEHSWLCCKL